MGSAAEARWTRATLSGRYPLRRRRPLMGLALAGMLVVLAACNQGTSVGAKRTEGDAVEGSLRTVSTAALGQRGGLCEENRRVSNPPTDSPEWVIWRLYQLALAPDTDETFQAFTQLFPSSKNVRDLKEMYWGRIRGSVHKYTVEPGKPDFVICRSIATTDGRKYYVLTSDPRQTPPPITVGEAEGRNRIIFLTPF